MMDSREPDLQTLFMLHELENGLNPELNCGLWSRILGTDLD